MSSLYNGIKWVEHKGFYIYQGDGPDKISLVLCIPGAYSSV